MNTGGFQSTGHNATFSFSHANNFNFSFNSSRVIPPGLDFLGLPSNQAAILLSNIDEPGLLTAADIRFLIWQDQALHVRDQIHESLEEQGFRGDIDEQLQLLSEYYRPEEPFRSLYPAALKWTNIDGKRLAEIKELCLSSGPSDCIGKELSDGTEILDCWDSVTGHTVLTITVTSKSQKRIEAWRFPSADNPYRFHSSDAIEIVLEESRRRVAEYSTAETRFLMAAPTHKGKHALFFLGSDSASLSAAQWNALSQEEVEDADWEPLDRLIADATETGMHDIVIWRPPWVRRAKIDNLPNIHMFGGKHAYPGSFFLLEALEDRYGDQVNFSIAEDMPLAVKNAPLVQNVTVSSAKEIAVYVIGDFSHSKDIESKFTWKDLADLRAPEQPMIIIMGENNDDFREQVLQMGGRGMFAGKIVILLSCDSVLQPETNQILTNEHRALGVETFSVKLSREQTPLFLVRGVASVLESGMGRLTASEILDIASEEYSKNDKTKRQYEKTQNQRKKFLRHYIQISRKGDSGGVHVGSYTRTEAEIRT